MGPSHDASRVLIGFSGVRIGPKITLLISIILHLAPVRLTSSYLQADDSLTSEDDVTLRASKDVCDKGARVRLAHIIANAMRKINRELSESNDDFESLLRTGDLLEFVRVNA